MYNVLYEYKKDLHRAVCYIIESDRDALELIEEEEKKGKIIVYGQVFETLEEAEAECKAQDERMNGYY